MIPNLVQSTLENEKTPEVTKEFVKEYLKELCDGKSAADFNQERQKGLPESPLR